MCYPIPAVVDDRHAFFTLRRSVSSCAAARLMRMPGITTFETTMKSGSIFIPSLLKDHSAPDRYHLWIKRVRSGVSRVFGNGQQTKTLSFLTNRPRLPEQAFVRNQNYLQLTAELRHLFPPNTARAFHCPSCDVGFKEENGDAQLRGLGSEPVHLP